MNINRLIWISTTALFAFIGFLMGLSLGRLYLVHFVAFDSVKEPARTLIGATLAIGTSIILARLGSWLADRFLLSSLNRMQHISAADKVLGVVGLTLGVLLGALISFTLPSGALWLPIKLCAMAVCGVFGGAILQGMRDEMLHAFPALETSSTPGGSNCAAKIIDTNIIIDGRITDICKTGFIEGPLYVPSFVLEEVQHIADSSDSLKRARGRRGLEVLNQMRELTVADPAHPDNPVSIVHVINDFSPAVRRISSVDSKLVALAKETGAAIITNDFNLNRVAELQGVRVLNLNELVHALRPVVLPGEEMSLMISREGKEAGQGVGYLEDGTMVVVDDGRRYIGQTCDIIISSVIQTVAGKMIFAQMKPEEKNNQPTDDTSPSIKGPGDDLFDDSHTNSYPSTGNDSSRHSGSGLRRKNRA
jgi:uncharacterized protein YacL